MDPHPPPIPYQSPQLRPASPQFFRTPTESPIHSDAESDPDVPPSRDADYYIQDEMAIFLVEHRLYKVHRHFFIRESEVFRTMFSCPLGQNTMEGMTDDLPISLPGVTRFEFKTLLDFFYNRLYFTSMHDDFQLSLNEWAAILSISSRYDMDRIRQRAIRQIQSYRPRIDPVEKIVLAEKHDITDWLPSAYASLCQRVNPLEEWEAEKLGLRITVKLARAREAVRQLGPNGFSFCTTKETDDTTEDEMYNSYEVSRVVEEVFFPSSSGIPSIPHH